MAKRDDRKGGVLNIEVFLGGAPLLEMRLVEGLLRFGQSHPQWRFALRGADFRYTSQWLKRRCIAGALALIEAKPVENALNAAGIPWVHLLPTDPVKHPFVNVDNHVIGRIGAEFFLDKGFSHFAFCGVGTSWSEERAAGFRNRLRDAGKTCLCANIPFETTLYWEFSAGFERQLGQWISQLERGTAVMIAHDALANRVVDLCLRKKRRIPEDIAVLGVGNHDLLCKLSPIPISSIDTDVPNVAVSGAQMLEAMIAGNTKPAPTYVSPVPVVERRSTEKLAYDDELVAEIVAYIRDNSCDGVTVGELLEKFPISRRTLARRFDEYVGHSPGMEIQQARLRHAKRLLASTRLSLSEIALACGYSDLSHMDRAFRKILGACPRELRKG